MGGLCWRLVGCDKKKRVRLQFDDKVNHHESDNDADSACDFEKDFKVDLDWKGFGSDDRLLVMFISIDWLLRNRLVAFIE